MRMRACLFLMSLLFEKKLNGENHFLRKNRKIVDKLPKTQHLRILSGYFERQPLYINDC